MTCVVCVLKAGLYKPGHQTLILLPNYLNLSTFLKGCQSDFNSYLYFCLKSIKGKLLLLHVIPFLTIFPFILIFSNYSVLSKYVPVLCFYQSSLPVSAFNSLVWLICYCGVSVSHAQIPDSSMQTAHAQSHATSHLGLIKDAHLTITKLQMLTRLAIVYPCAFLSCES